MAILTDFKKSWISSVHVIAVLFSMLLCEVTTNPPLDRVESMETTTIVIPLINDTFTADPSLLEERKHDPELLFLPWLQSSKSNFSSVKYNEEISLSSDEAFNRITEKPTTKLSWITSAQRSRLNSHTEPFVGSLPTFRGRLNPNQIEHNRQVPTRKWTNQHRGRGSRKFPFRNQNRARYGNENFHKNNENPESSRNSHFHSVPSRVPVEINGNRNSKPSRYRVPVSSQVQEDTSPHSQHPQTNQNSKLVCPKCYLTHHNSAHDAHFREEKFHSEIPEDSFDNFEKKPSSKVSNTLHLSSIEFDESDENIDETPNPTYVDQQYAEGYNQSKLFGTLYGKSSHIFNVKGHSNHFYFLYQKDGVPPAISTFVNEGPEDPLAMDQPCSKECLETSASHTKVHQNSARHTTTNAVVPHHIGDNENAIGRLIKSLMKCDCKPAQKDDSFNSLPSIKRYDHLPGKQEKPSVSLEDIEVHLLPVLKFLQERQDKIRKENQAVKNVPTFKLVKNEDTTQRENLIDVITEDASEEEIESDEMPNKIDNEGKEDKIKPVHP